MKLKFKNKVVAVSITALIAAIFSSPLPASAAFNTGDVETSRSGSTLTVTVDCTRLNDSSIYDLFVTPGDTITFVSAQSDSNACTNMFFGGGADVWNPALVSWASEAVSSPVSYTVKSDAPEGQYWWMTYFRGAGDNGVEFRLNVSAELPSITLTPDTIGPGEVALSHIVNATDMYVCVYIEGGPGAMNLGINFPGAADVEVYHDVWTGMFGAPLTMRYGLFASDTCPESYTNTVAYATINLTAGESDGGSGNSSPKATVKFAPGSSTAITSTLNKALNKVGANTKKVTLSALATKSTRSLVRARLAEVKAAFIQRTGLSARKITTKMRVMAKVTTNVVEVKFDRGTPLIG